MPRQRPGEVPITFQDVAACFSKEEWKLLHEWQEELYSNVMKEIQQTLLSLGPVIATSVFSLKAKGRDSVDSVDEQDLERRHSNGRSARHERTARIKEEDHSWDVAYQDPKQENPYCCTEDLPDPTEVISFSIEEEEAACSVNLQRTERKARTKAPSGRSVTEQPRHQQEEKEDMAEDSGPGSIITVIAGSIKEEGGACLMDELEAGSLNEKEYRAPEFEKSFPFEQGCLYHQKLHTGVRPFACTLCEKSFFQKAYLVQHLKFHTGIRPFRCNECPKSFKLKSDLHRHQRIHTGVRPFVCTVCQKSFTRKANLLQHERIHTGVRPFPCTECDKSFTAKTDLRCHQTVHSGVRPFACPECDKSFARKINLLQHQRLHTGVRPFSCPECEKRFTSKANLMRHQRRHRRTSTPSANP
ncbi:zinc finger protein interacting with ribonucleoprotein K-like isoform X3 [Ambystoma mexicanum]|uniref:zinc finger protein interacting with ribonucleoprotein K-like isoform X3 n=1 Tax=Ambystoma mexicanum TaxID=8296 RepID=UPI0037E7C0A9